MLRRFICCTKWAICILISIWDTSVWHVCGLLRCITEQPVITKITWCIQARWARFGVEVVNCTLYREADARLASLSPPPGTQDGNLSPLPGTQDSSSSPTSATQDGRSFPLSCVPVNGWFDFRPPVHKGKVTVPEGVRNSQLNVLWKMYKCSYNKNNFGRLDGTVCALQYVHMVGHLLKLSPTTTVYSPSNGQWKLNSSSHVPW